MKNMKFKTPVFAGGNMRVDKDQAAIYGVAVAQNVEATGHSAQVDTQALLMLAEMGNLAGRAGLKSRFGHPSASQTALGTQLATAHNFRVDYGQNGKSDTLRADYHFLEAARISPQFENDPVEYMLAMAEEAPQHFGNSIVFDTEFVWVLEGGDEVEYSDERPSNSLYKHPVVRPVAFSAVDIVDSPAATRDGLFSQTEFNRTLGVNWEKSPDGIAAMFSTVADEAIEEFARMTGKTVEEATAHASQFAVRYFLSKGVITKYEEENKMTDEVEVEDVQSTVAEETAVDQEVIEEEAETVVTDSDEQEDDHDAQDDEETAVEDDGDAIVDPADNISSPQDQVVTLGQLGKLFDELTTTLASEVATLLAEHTEDVDTKLSSNLAQVSAMVEESIAERKLFETAQPSILRKKLSTAVGKLDNIGVTGSGIDGRSELGRDKPKPAKPETSGRKFPKGMSPN